MLFKTTCYFFVIEIIIRKEHLIYFVCHSCNKTIFYEGLVILIVYPFILLLLLLMDVTNLDVIKYAVNLQKLRVEETFFLEFFFKKLQGLKL